MNLWWLVTSSVYCSYSELKQRRCLALGWREIGDLERYIKEKKGWERQFKTFVQLKGNIAYPRDKRWTEEDSALTGVPTIFWNLLQIREGDYVAVIETGNQLTLGSIEVRGVGRVTQDAMRSYHFNEEFHHAHEVCAGLEWKDWDLAHYGELDKPSRSFKALLQDNDQLDKVDEAWGAITAE
ncbi:hypothetical protein [Saccharospirillum salsuginis]|nr:hypothetical protein [Saccharospirillum salsuginis]